MKIALVGLTHPFRGGIAHYTTLLCRALARRHDVRFFSLSRQYPEFLFPGKTQKDTSAAAFSVENEPTLDSMNPLSWWGTGRRIAAYAPDLALFSWWHPFFGPSFGTVARVARRGGVPSCFLCHNVIPHETSRVDRMLSRYAFNGSAGFITHSHEDAANLKQLLPHAHVRHNPHPTYDAFAEGPTPDATAARAALNLDGKRVLLFFGYVRPYKGLAHLLDAVLALDDTRYHALVVGEFYEPKEKYAEQFDALSARGQLTLVDRYVANEEVPQFYAAADLVMVPYLSATQSGIVQMAYGFGRPVIATTVGGLPEVVTDDATGYLVPPGDAAALAAAVRRYYDAADPGRFAQAIEAERDKYSWERMVETVEAVAANVR